MNQLDALTQQARALASGPLVLTGAENEVARQMQICNACRYCEGFCGVFPAMTRRLEFGKADIHFLANLCHNCGACLHACQYAPPHEFAVNVPQAMAKVRAQTYTDFAWPAALGVLYQRNGLTLALALVTSLTLFLTIAVAANGELFKPPVEGSFYSIFPHNLLVSMFAPVFLFVVIALGIGVKRFWHTVSPDAKNHPTNAASKSSAGAATEAAVNALSLKYLDGGHGEGCHNEDDAWTHWRRRFHHATFYGFLLCFAATSAATIYHYVLGWVAPYGWPSLPKLLGVVGGISLCVGAAGLFSLNLKRHPLHGDMTQRAMDRGFIALLFLTALSGLALWLARSTPALAALLALHLAAVMALFLTLPYGKFAHGIYRSAALLQWAIEKRRPKQLTLGDD